MKLDGRRESTNVEDRRSSAGKVAGIAGGAGLIGLIITLVMQFMGGCGSGIGGSVIEEALPEVLGSVLGGQTETVGEATFSEEEQELASFSKKILASTEDVWTKVFKQMGKTYQPPTLVLYTGSTSTRCASVIGDDYLQKKAQGFAVEDSFTHGTAAQRMRWLKKGLTTGDMSKRDTYNIPANQL